MRLRHLCLLATVSALPFGLPQGALAQSGAALTGVVSSQEEGNMEGVLVNAKKEGSTITITVPLGPRTPTESANAAPVGWKRNWSRAWSVTNVVAPRPDCGPFVRTKRAR